MTDVTSYEYEATPEEVAAWSEKLRHMSTSHTCEVHPWEMRQLYRVYRSLELSVLPEHGANVGFQAPALLDVETPRATPATAALPDAGSVEHARRVL